jgi:hypothetical protein
MNMVADTFAAESQAVTRLSNILSHHLVPLFAAAPGGRPKLVGSSFLVSSGMNSYLVSAAHVFDELKAGHELFFYIEPKVMRKLSGNLRLTKTPPGKDRKSDRLDVGVLKLEGPALPPYPKVQKYPLPISAFMTNALPREGKQYLLVGFPESKSRANPATRKLESELRIFRNISAPASKYSELDVSPENHIVLNFDVKNTVTPNREIRAFPHPSGMSGSPIWLLYDKDGPNDPVQTSIVGIAIEHHKTERAIVATDIDIAFKLINEAV